MSLHPNRRYPVIPSLTRIILPPEILQITHALLQPQTNPAISIIIKNRHAHPPDHLYRRYPVIESRRQGVISLPSPHAKILPAKIGVAIKASTVLEIPRML